MFIFKKFLKIAVGTKLLANQRSYDERANGRKAAQPIGEWGTKGALVSA
jgi:hypothetical protein